MAAVITQVSCNKSFGGYQKVYSHDSSLLKCQMKFAVYLPPQAEDGKCPLLYFLSGLTCTEQNFIQKAGAQKFASQHGFIVVAPDTSPRGCNIPGEDDKWNVGTGASLYVDATQKPWSDHYQMYSYIVSELPAIIEQNFPVLPDRSGIFGHSMGGHGALLCALLNPGKYKSVSAFAPACNSVRCTPFQEALTSYLGSDVQEHNKWNATELAKKYDGPPLHLLIDQGTEDEFLAELYPEEFTKACTESRISVVLNMREGYDHGYYFVSSFIEDHFIHHAKFLK